MVVDVSLVFNTFRAVVIIIKIEQYSRHYPCASPQGEYRVLLHFTIDPYGQRHQDCHSAFAVCYSKYTSSASDSMGCHLDYSVVETYNPH